MKRNVSVVRAYLLYNILISGNIIKELPGLVGSGTPCIYLRVMCDKDVLLVTVTCYSISVPAASKRTRKSSTSKSRFYPVPEQGNSFPQETYMYLL
jgi:hypothetical protein